MVTGFMNKSGSIKCNPCLHEAGEFCVKYIQDDAFHPCYRCGRDASFPHWRDAKLYELDGVNCKQITGMSYDELRQFATSLFSQDTWVEENQNAPCWDAILSLQARDVWEWRQRTLRQAKARVITLQEVVR